MLVEVGHARPGFLTHPGASGFWICSVRLRRIVPETRNSARDMKPDRAAACSTGPRAFCGDLRLFAEPHHKPAGPRMNRVALR
ncbi:MAG: hypothetical protein JWO48_3317, partial [Bryobacterales bacterium]|nr:hypothetical protein [Bryobacterales bacterium]